MASSIPFANVSVNRFGFNILDIKINLVNTDEPRRMAVMMVLIACGITNPQDQAYHMEWLEDNYTQSITNHETVNPAHNTFYLNDDLVTFRYEVQHDKH